MKELIINNSLALIRKQFPNYSEEKMEEIEYGLVGLYLTISKLIIIFLIAFLLGILKEVLIFMVTYNIIRTTSFGLHATKSWICLVSSTLIFISAPVLCNLLTLPIWLRIIIGIICICLVFKNSPADTEKRPIVSPKRRRTYKILSTIIAIIFVVLTFIITDNFLANCFIFALVVQCFMISPFIYKIFNLPYNNYKNYQLLEE